MMKRREFLVASLGLVASVPVLASSRQPEVARPFFMNANEFDAAKLLADWRWRISGQVKPLYLTAFGDWVFLLRNGKITRLDMLEGNYSVIAESGESFNQQVQSRDWVAKEFLFDWYEIALSRGLKPNRNECLGWEVSPIIGGDFSAENLKIYGMSEYQGISAAIHQSLRTSK